MNGSNPHKMRHRRHNNYARRYTPPLILLQKLISFNQKERCKLKTRGQHPNRDRIIKLLFILKIYEKPLL